MKPKIYLKIWKGNLIWVIQDNRYGYKYFGVYKKLKEKQK